ncbi:hypothetical protein B296_00028127 [Ensete ventricosum]|uniref:Retrotransposon gag domain-containing protein n=1 Tax=Ensete ventricosum TaxID=4639 RepID=A0A427A725_ENSVE|nr:hypothetical protein B296_00028127 [Ensete ventricosum]
MTLCGIARGWYGQLSLTSIHSFDQLMREFEANFLASAWLKPTATSLLEMRKRTERAEYFVPQLPSIPLNSTRTEIFLQIWDKGLLKTPNPMRTRVEECDRGCYCRLHHDYGHDIEECYDLKNQIEYLIWSSVDILHLDAFQKLNMTNQDLIPMTSTLTGFTGDAITPVGITTLPMPFDDEPRTKTFMVHFMVVELPSAYNVIIARPTLNKLMTIVSTYHHSMKFPTSGGPREVRNDSQESR